MATVNNVRFGEAMQAVSCPHCERRVNASLSHVGSKAKCKACKKPLQIVSDSAGNLQAVATTTIERKSASRPQPRELASPPASSLLRKMKWFIGSSVVTIVLLLAFIGFKSIEKEYLSDATGESDNQGAVVENQEQPAFQQQASEMGSAQPQIIVHETFKPRVVSVSEEKSTSGKSSVYTITRDWLPASQNLMQLGPSPDITDLFQEDLDFSGDQRNLTLLYNQEIPEGKQTADTLQAFIDRQPTVKKLPVSSQVVNLLDEDTPLHFDEYLRYADGLYYDILTNRRIDAGIVSVQGRRFKGSLEGEFYSLKNNLEHYEETMAKKQVPPSALTFHRLAIGVSEFLRKTCNAIEQACQNGDPIRARVYAKQFMDAYTTYEPLLHQENDRMRRRIFQLQAGGGLGIKHHVSNGEFVVVLIVPGGAAQKDGRLKPGDRILSINQQSISGLSELEIGDLLQGKPGTPITLEVVSGPMPDIAKERAEARQTTTYR